ncbi:MAG: hypothetical protein JW846_01910 [Dehalococcoidia bacterium]|nr:hypothetical protein [Dehalococcoidia bacterium]
MRTHSLRLQTLVVPLLALCLLCSATVGCSPEDKPLPAPKNVGVTLSPGAEQSEDMIVVTWDASTDSRVEGYAIYRAEQGLGSPDGEKTEVELQAVTFATSYKDVEIHTTELYSTVRYYYQIQVIAEDGNRGPMSEEVEIEYAPVG